MLFSHWAECEERELVVFLWGSEQESLQRSIGVKTKLRPLILNRTTVNALRMTSHTMKDYFSLLNRRLPKLIVADAQSIYDLACFAQRQGIFGSRAEWNHYRGCNAL
jgi:hypothetical protein